MRTLAFVSLILITFNAQAATQAQKCSTGMAQMAGQQGREAATKFEIAQLMIERSNLLATNEAALRALVDKNVNQKVAEFKARFGKDLDPEEMKLLISDIESGQQQKKATAKQAETKRRVEEKQSLTVTKRIFLEDIGNYHTLDDSYFGNEDTARRNNNIVGGGVQWCADEKYVAFRNTDRRTRIYDTEARKFISYEPPTGIISKSGGHLFAENDKDQTTIRDLDTNQVWGPLKGNPVSDLFNGEFIITRYEVQRPHTVIKQYDNVLHDYRHDRHIVLGEDFTISADRKIVVRAISDSKIEVLEIATGKLLKTFDVDATQFRMSWSPGNFFTYRKNDKAHFVSLNNLNDVLVPFDSEPYLVSGDGLKLLFKTPGAKLRKFNTVIYDVSTGRQLEIKNFSEGFLNPDRTKVILYVYEGKVTVMVDLNIMTRRNLKGYYNRWSDNSRWVYSSTSDGQWYNHKVYDLFTDQTETVRAGFSFDFIGQSDFIMNQTPYLPPAKDITRTFVNNLTQYNGNPFSLEIGEREAKPSPSGRFVLTYHGGKVELSEFMAK